MNYPTKIEVAYAIHKSGCEMHFKMVLLGCHRKRNLLDEGKRGSMRYKSKIQEYYLDRIYPLEENTGRYSGFKESLLLQIGIG